ncbi:GAF domain-containing protein [Patellaria atrata CBS 101060]|uniref:GAF domain-containing protein n=1 Tax=Patellaria atrata CBS 101060 TaxID=1346257 RepID=A0A9P4S997_9PEZI|nr:GAF domain-containing protein [Patellaria atrata CBS 101060]
MVHADASTFSSNLSKKEVYARVLEQAEALFEGQSNWVSNLSNASSLLHHALRSLPLPSSAVNWCGFYFVDPARPKQLILGPFQGHVACQTIEFGKGVCGTAAQSGKTQLVGDVEAFPGHIACDGASRSEIVVPIDQLGKVVAILDIDCAEVDGFDEEDQAELEKLCDLISKSSVFPFTLDRLHA